jgi:hypothetical protein
VIFCRAGAVNPAMGFLLESFTQILDYFFRIHREILEMQNQARKFVVINMPAEFTFCSVFHVAR